MLFRQVAPTRLRRGSDELDGAVGPEVVRAELRMNGRCFLARVGEGRRAELRPGRCARASPERMEVEGSSGEVSAPTKSSDLGEVAILQRLTDRATKFSGLVDLANPVSAGSRIVQRRRPDIHLPVTRSSWTSEAHPRPTSPPNSAQQARDFN